MASYHFHVQIIGKARGYSAIAAAAYRSATRLVDRANGQVHDYCRKRGVVHAEVMLPKGAAAWLSDREKLWNHVHARENRHDAQYAREINLALPHELTPEQRLGVLRGFVDSQFVTKGMVADIAIHAPVPERGDDPRNHHAHIMLTLRQAHGEGLSHYKSRQWNAAAELKSWRAAWDHAQNRALAEYNHRHRVDHRSLKVQYAEALDRGDNAEAHILDRQSEIHIGRRAISMARNERRPRSLTEASAGTELPPPPGHALRPPFTPVKPEPIQCPEGSAEHAHEIGHSRPPPQPERAVISEEGRHSRSPPGTATTAATNQPRPFVRTTWSFAVVPRTRDTPTTVRPLFRIVVRETRPHRNWRRKVRHPEHLTRLEFNLKRLQNNRLRVRTWVKSGKATRARLMIEWRQLSRIVAWLRSHGGDPELINQFLVRLAANQRLFWMLAKSIKRMQAEETRLARRCFDVQLTVRRKRVAELTAERSARRRRRRPNPQESAKGTNA